MSDTWDPNKSICDPNKGNSAKENYIRNAGFELVTPNKQMGRILILFCGFFCQNVWVQQQQILLYGTLDKTLLIQSAKESTQGTKGKSTNKHTKIVIYIVIKNRIYLISQETVERHKLLFMVSFENVYS